MTKTLEQAQTEGLAPWGRLTVDLGTVKVFADGFPVTPGHRLFVPTRDHPDEVAQCFKEACRYGEIMVERGACDGYNVGMNRGQAAGQTVMYPHVHCIPRRQGDCADPVGGVRGVIPGQANYKKETYRNPCDN